MAQAGVGVLALSKGVEGKVAGERQGWTAPWSPNDRKRMRPPSSDQTTIGGFLDERHITKKDGDSLRGGRFQANGNGGSHARRPTGVGYVLARRLPPHLGGVAPQNRHDAAKGTGANRATHYPRNHGLLGFNVCRAQAGQQFVRRTKTL